MNATTSMSVNGISCMLHMPRATTSRFDARGVEQVGHLAPSAPVSVLSVDDYPECPRDWQRSDPSVGLKSYFFAAKVGHMVWLDFNGNSAHPNHVAAIISAQGVNALTGRRVAWPLQLEQYKFNCPNHDKPFSGNRFCKDCGFEWPGQNYLPSNVTPGGAFWRDGFRAEDGVTREFLFTEEAERGVAKSIIGDARNFAFSLAMYVSREPKPRPAYSGRRGGPQFLGGGAMDDSCLESMPMRSRGASKSIEVGAGAMVNQSLNNDTQPLEFWQESPTALIRIYYCGTADFEDIVRSGGGSPAPGGGGSFLGGVKTGKTF